jgi:hypothetical protein
MRIPTTVLAALVASAAGTLALFASPAGAVQNQTSRNWAGYAVTKSNGSFRKVAGSWVVPKPNCSTRSPGYSAAWVGLGGFGQSAYALEQVGVDALCNSSGQRRYGAWYELVPAPGHRIAMAVHGGDRMSGSVEVQGATVSVRLRNRTTGALFTKTASMSTPDVRSAEWIVETPSSCTDSGGCKLLPLADFGTVPFSSASATTRSGGARSISDPAFSVFRITLRPAGKSYGAVPSGLSSGGTAFSVNYRKQLAASGARARTLVAHR